MDYYEYIIFMLKYYNKRMFKYYILNNFENNN